MRTSKKSSAEHLSFLLQTPFSFIISETICTEKCRTKKLLNPMRLVRKIERKLDTKKALIDKIKGCHQ